MLGRIYGLQFSEVVTCVCRIYVFMSVVFVYSFGPLGAHRCLLPACWGAFLICCQRVAFLVVIMLLGARLLFRSLLVLVIGQTRVFVSFFETFVCMYLCNAHAMRPLSVEDVSVVRRAMKNTVDTVVSALSFLSQGV